MSRVPSKTVSTERTAPNELSKTTLKSPHSIGESPTSARVAALSQSGQRAGGPVSPNRDVSNQFINTKLLTLKEAANQLAISLPTIRAWVWQRKIEIVKIGRCVRIREHVISELILKSTIPPTAEP
jgi:excisionase family DNA binding protein